MYYRFEKRRRK